ncbi:hypothetical protein, partial [Burkholderia sp. Bp8990]|uniref:hypothetical protein n=1 Tax=Burkholderia sp. Bp8990 TaxID=2184552 RepID=UPI001C8A9FEC
MNESLAPSLGDKLERPDVAALRKAVQAGIDSKASLDVLCSNPLGKWLESSIALAEAPTGLVRGRPQTLTEVIQRLASDAGVDA